MMLCSLLGIYIWTKSKQRIIDSVIVIVCAICFNCKINRFWLYHIINMPYKMTLFFDIVLRILAFLILMYIFIKRKKDEILINSGS